METSDQMWSRESILKTETCLQPGQSSSLLWMARKDLSAAGEGPQLLEGRRPWEGSFLYSSFPRNAPSPTVVENQYKQSLRCSYIFFNSKWSNPAFCFPEGRKLCKSVQPDMSSHRMAASSSASLEKDSPVSSFPTVSLVIGFPFI